MDGADATYLLTLERVPARQAVAELAALPLPSACRVTTERGRVRIVAPASAAAGLSRLTLPERVWASVGEWPVATLPNADDPALLGELKTLVGTASGWQPSLQAWAVVHDSPHDQGHRTLRVIGKRAGKRFAAVPSAALAGALGAELSRRFGWGVDLDAPSFEVSVSLNDDGLSVTLALLRRAEPALAEVESGYGLHPHVAWAAARTIAPALHRDARVLDPMCGSGSLLLELLRGWPGLLALGADSSLDQLTRAQTNDARLRTCLRQHGSGVPAPLLLMHADACSLPLPDGSADACLCDLPFGVQHGTVENNVELYPRVLAELARVLRDKARGVLLTNDANERTLLACLGDDAPLRLLARRRVPLGLQEGWFFVVERRSREATHDGAASMHEADSVVERLDWESREGRAGWSALRKAEAPRGGLVPVASYNRKRIAAHRTTDQPTAPVEGAWVDVSSTTASTDETNCP